LQGPNLNTVDRSSGPPKREKKREISLSLSLLGDETFACAAAQNERNETTTANDDDDDDDDHDGGGDFARARSGKRTSGTAMFIMCR
tara:strand:+ start:3225 stop:3485 length:261 start_codon:yes stop_codon:yes gene_type:complete